MRDNLQQKARPKPTPTDTSSHVKHKQEIRRAHMSIPYRERQWIDIEPKQFSHNCFEVSKYMVRSLRHDESVLREEDRAVRFDDLTEKFNNKFPSTKHLPVSAWITFLAEGGGPKERFKYCLNPILPYNSFTSEAIQGHSGGTLVDPTLQDNVLLPNDFTKFFYHIRNVHDMHSITNSGLIPGGKRLKKDRQSKLFTAVNPMDEHQYSEDAQYDLNKARIAVYSNGWRIHKDSVYWRNLKLAQKRGLQFYQTRSNAIALFNTLLTICIEEAVYMKTGQELYSQVFTDTPAERHIFTCTVIAQLAQHSSHDFSWLKVKGLCLPKTIAHPRIMSHPPPHCTLNTSTSSLSPTSPVLLSSSTLNPDLLSPAPFIHKDPRRMAVLRPSIPPQVLSPKGSSSTGICQSTKSNN